MKTKRAMVALSVAAVVALAPVAAMARNGADDPTGHHANDDRGKVTRVVARGHDDPKGHDANDDHGRTTAASPTQGMRSSDDPAGDGRGQHEAEPGDDNGGQGEIEQGDDNGGQHEAEPGDDHGGHGNEPGDDHGGR
jgi:hypothetical protein